MVLMHGIDLLPIAIKKVKHDAKTNEKILDKLSFSDSVDSIPMTFHSSLILASTFSKSLWKSMNQLIFTLSLYFDKNKIQMMHFYGIFCNLRIVIAKCCKVNNPSYYVDFVSLDSCHISLILSSSSSSPIDIPFSSIHSFNG